ncbi:MAG: tRNA (guanosine(46)-N7)-methyltransferase TrmB [Verrucomicrobia bacterium]|nr:tRNA (guanosine(46)-N7)-methyltransferase TrmB [Verrucomicrobiota bacterium]
MDPSTEQISASAQIKPETWTQSLSIGDYFTSKAPLEVDIGCGKGRFLLARAAANPNVNFLGIERLLVRIRKIDKKIQKQGLKNVRLLRIEASYALQYLLQPGTVTTFYMFFPDPWPKRRHHRRRTFNDSFIDSLDRILLSGGCIHLATDHLEYFDIMKALLTADKRFVEDETFVPNDEEKTDFELLFLSQKLQIGRCSFKKL